MNCTLCRFGAYPCALQLHTMQFWWLEPSFPHPWCAVLGQWRCVLPRNIRCEICAIGMIRVISHSKKSSADPHGTTATEVQHSEFGYFFKQWWVSQPFCRKRIMRHALCSVHEFRDYTETITQTTSLIPIYFLCIAIFIFQFLLLSNQDTLGEGDHEPMNNNGSASRGRKCSYNQIYFRKVVFKSWSAHSQCTSSHSGHQPSSKGPIPAHPGTRKKNLKQKEHYEWIPVF